ncbi:MAG: hypothetical protein ACP5NV_01570 [Candidatus Woesearchaeota archaeon]
MIFALSGTPLATMNALNKSNYTGSAYVGNSYWPVILISIAVFVALCIALYLLNKKFNLAHYVREFFRADCAFCGKPLEKKEGIRKTINWEGTMIMRKMAFCNENHLNEYSKKFGEPIGCCASCVKTEKYSFMWWIQFAKIATLILFVISIIVIYLVRN